MRILMLADLYPPFKGGLEAHVAMLSEKLARIGHEVTVFTIESGDVHGVREEHGVTVESHQGLFQRIPFIYGDAAKRYPPPVEDPVLMRKLEKTICRTRPDIVHAHGWILYSLLGLMTRWNVPLVTTLHDYGFVCPKRTLMTSSGVCTNVLTTDCVSCARSDYGLLKSIFSYFGVRSNRRKLSVVNKFIAVSSFVRDIYLRHLDVNRGNFVVIPNFYEADKEDAPSALSARGHTELPEDFVLFVGALAPYKGADLLIESFDGYGNTKLVLIGRSAPGFSYVSTDKIMIIENAADSLVREAYSKCRFTVVPSVFPDPCPTVAFEAMSFGKAIVASAIGGLTEIVSHNETGVLVAPNDRHDLWKACEYLLERPTLAREMGAKGRSRLIEHFSTERVVPEIERVYRSLVA
jgi:glycosyltransferase involved in cell wall biosynthesis